MATSRTEPADERDLVVAAVVHVAPPSGPTPNRDALPVLEHGKVAGGLGAAAPDAFGHVWGRGLLQHPADLPASDQPHAVEEHVLGAVARGTDGGGAGCGRLVVRGGPCRGEGRMGPLRWVCLWTMAKFLKICEKKLYNYLCGEVWSKDRKWP